MQTSVFCEAPPPSEQAAAWLQALEEDAQTSPVADVQGFSEAPQTQGPALAVVPSPCGQAGPAKEHRQAWELWSQERVEDVYQLKRSPPPLVLLLVSKHPRGYS